MALVSSTSTGSSSDWSVVAAKPRSLMLKDFLRDEIGSSSSNGFRSFPRRQCCTTTVRFLLEIDLKVKDSSVPTRFLNRAASRKIALSTISTLQKASGAVVRAFKQFPFPSARNRNRKPFSPRKLLLRAFRMKSERQTTVDSSTRRWKSFQEFLDEKDPPSPPPHRNRSDSAACIAVAVAVAGRNSISSCSNSNSWTESEFASEMIPSSSGNSESSSENDAVKNDKDSPENFIGKREGATFGKDSMEETTAYREETAKEQWRSDEEKEQFSPVSVLDFPFDDEDQHISSSSFIEGKKKQKRFENGLELEPLDLKKRFGRCDFGLISKTEHQREQRAFEILNLVKSRIESECFVARTENLLLDFFHEKLEEMESTAEVLKLTEDWINGGGGGETALMAGWEVAEGRSLYVEEMEKAGKWRSFAGQIEELASEFEAEVWISLLHELLIDLS